MTKPNQIEKIERKVFVKMHDASRLMGFFYLEPGQRLQDIMNDDRTFLPLHLMADSGKRSTVVLSKRFIQQVEEVEVPSVSRVTPPLSQARSERRAEEDRRAGVDRRDSVDRRESRLGLWLEEMSDEDAAD